jgi:hypothetical protein
MLIQPPDSSNFSKLLYEFIGNEVLSKSIGSIALKPFLREHDDCRQPDYC